MKYTVYTTETVYRQFTIETDEDLETVRAELMTDEPFSTADFDVEESADSDSSELTVRRVESIEETQLRSQSSWTTDPYANEPAYLMQVQR